jgi:hypothetical protein
MGSKGRAAEAEHYSSAHQSREVQAAGKIDKRLIIGAIEGSGVAGVTNVRGNPAAGPPPRLITTYFFLFCIFSPPDDVRLTSQALGSHAPIVPTKILGDPDELDRHLLRSGADAHNLRRAQGDTSYDNGAVYGPDAELDLHVSIPGQTPAGIYRALLGFRGRGGGRTLSVARKCAPILMTRYSRHLQCPRPPPPAPLALPLTHPLSGKLILSPASPFSLAQVKYS